MPNWCVNKLYVTGPKADKARFFWHAAKGPSLEAALKARLEGEKLDELLDFNHFIPYPEEYAKADAAYHKAGGIAGYGTNHVKDGYNHGGYEWCVRNWGTKWGACETTSKSWGLQFRTAWGPPLPIINAMAKCYPTLTFTLKYFERGAGFQGVYTMKGEECLKNVQDSYSGNLGG